MIRVLINYGGSNTNERRIEPGDYAEDDPRLFGIADYLKQNGHAVEITVSTPPYIPPKPAEDEQFFTSIDIDEFGNPKRGARRSVTNKDYNPPASKVISEPLSEADETAFNLTGKLPDGWSLANEAEDDTPPDPAPEDKPKGKRR